VRRPASNSSWHGTHVAGTIAAVTNNTKGVAGVAYKAKVMPVRVLGHCGGLTSDIADAITWAAGGTVPGVPVNHDPAEVINMSLGGSGTCYRQLGDAAGHQRCDLAWHHRRCRRRQQQRRCLAPRRRPRARA
jgi:subtilisin family serine protease